MTFFVRGFVMFAKLAILIALAVVLAQSPGEAHLTWFGYQIDTTIGIMIAVVVLAVSGFFLLISIWRFVWRLPVKWIKARRNRLVRKGEAALLAGINAVAAEDYSEAVQQAKRARTFNPRQPLNLLLSAQSEYLSGKFDEADAFFTQMTKHPETAFLGFRGLILQARQHNNGQELRNYLQKALAVRPGSPWVLQQILELDLQSGNLAKASLVVEQMQLRQLITKQESRRRQGLIHWLKAEVAETAGDENGFIQAASSAHYEAPDISAITVRLAAKYREMGKQSKAQKLLLTSYGSSPHSEFGEQLVMINKNHSPLDQYREIEKLVKDAPHHPESLYLLALAAKNAKLWGQSSHFLTLLKDKVYSQRVFRLMAELEEVQNPHQLAQARQWWEKAASAPADPAWVCESCTFIAPAWHPLCSSCQGFDRIVWQQPGHCPQHAVSTDGSPMRPLLPKNTTPLANI
jgi:HemY protein